MKINLFAEVKILSQISIEINKEIFLKESEFDICNSARNIISEAGILTKLPIFLLAKSLLRYSDFASQNWHSIISVGSLSVLQSKTQKPIKKDFTIYNQRLKDLLLIYLCQQVSWNYNQISTEIRNIVRRLFNNYNLQFKSECHIFRHIFATNRSKNGFSNIDIAENLGNSPMVAGSSYVHSEIGF